jgi:hypothetical protein
MQKLASRTLIEHEAIVENAARAIFPSTRKFGNNFNYKIARDLVKFYEDKNSST